MSTPPPPNPSTGGGVASEKSPASLWATRPDNVPIHSPTPLPVPPGSSLSIVCSVLQSAMTQITVALQHQEITPSCAESLKTLLWTAEACLAERERCNQMERQSTALIQTAQRLILEENTRLRAQNEELKAQVDAIRSKDDEQPVYPDDSISCASSSSFSSALPSLFVRSCEASEVGSGDRSEASKSDGSSGCSQKPQQVQGWVRGYTLHDSS